MAATRSTSPATASSIGDVQVRNRGTIGGGSPTPTRQATCRRSLLALDYSAVLRSGGVNGSCRSTGSSRVPSRPTHRPTRSSVDAARAATAAPRGRTRRWPTRRRAIRSSGSARSSRRPGARSRTRASRSPASARSYRAKAVESALMGSDGSPSAVAAAAAHATDGQTVNSDIYADRAYRSKMAEVCSARHRRRARPQRALPSASGIARRAAHPRSTRPRLAGAVLTRDLTVDVEALVEGPAPVVRRPAGARRARSPVRR